MQKLTVYYGARCGLCCATRAWIERQHKLVRVECVPAEEPGAELKVIADSGDIWDGDAITTSRKIRNVPARSSTRAWAC